MCRIIDYHLLTVDELALISCYPLFFTIHLYIILPIIIFCATKKKEHVVYAVDKNSGPYYVPKGSNEDIHVVKLTDVEKSSQVTIDDTVKTLVAKQKSRRSRKEKVTEDLKPVRSSRSRKTQRSEKTQESRSQRFDSPEEKGRNATKRAPSYRKVKKSVETGEECETSRQERKSRRSHRKDRIEVPIGKQKSKARQGQSPTKHRANEKPSNHSGSPQNLSKNKSKKIAKSNKESKQEIKHDITIPQNKSVSMAKNVDPELISSKKPNNNDVKGGDINQMFKNLANDPRIISLLSQVPSTMTPSDADLVDIKDQFGTTEVFASSADVSKNAVKLPIPTLEQKNLKPSPSFSSTKLKPDATPKSNISE